jgi:folate-binding protein YgfZ
MEDVSITEREENCYTLIGDVDGGLPALHVLETCADFFGEDPEIPKITENEYQAQRILAGVPIAGNDYDLKTLAMELGQNFIDTRIAFEKGCYTGQEIVERIRSRGRTHKSLIGLKSKDEFNVPEQIRVTSAAYAESHGHVALAFAPIEYSEIGKLVGNAIVMSLPFPRGDL